jgi:hypothetical protein
VAVYDRAGSLLPVEASQSDLTVGFSPVYLVRNP